LFRFLIFDTPGISASSNLAKEMQHFKESGHLSKKAILIAGEK
jgi:hypothetical protein